MLQMADPRRRTRRVLIEKLERDQAANGEPVETWEPAWADADGNPVLLSAEKLAGRALEKFVVQQRIATMGDVFLLAWAPANQIDPGTHRLTHEGRTMNIVGVVEVGHRAGVAITCDGIAAAPQGAVGPS